MHEAWRAGVEKFIAIASGAAQSGSKAETYD
jgi:hypothetical protein